MAISRSCHHMHTAFAILLLLLPCMSWCLLSDYKICGDPECESLMSRVQATEDFQGKDCRFLSFTRGDTIFVYHKLTGRRQDLWAGSINKQFGYFPRDAVKEEEVYATTEKVLQTQKFDFFCQDENAYPTDSSHLETNDDENQGDSNSETNHGGPDNKRKEDGGYSMSQDSSQLNHQGALLSESKGHTEDFAGTLENMEPGDSSGDRHVPNKQGGSPSSSSSSTSWFGSTVTGFLGMQQGSEHAEIQNTPEEDEGTKAEETDNALASSVKDWLGYGEQGKTDEIIAGQEDDKTEMGEADATFTSTMNSWLGYGDEKTNDAMKNVKAEMEIVEDEEDKVETFRSRKIALDLERHQLQGEELINPGTFGWLGDTLSSTIGFGPTQPESGLEEKTHKEELEITYEDVKPSPSTSWYDIGIGDVLGFGNNAGNVDSTVEGVLNAQEDDTEKQIELQSMTTSPSPNDHDTKETPNAHNGESSRSPPQQQPNEKEIIADNKFETETNVSAGINREEDSVSIIGDLTPEQKEEASKMDAELRDTMPETLPLNDNGDIDEVLDSISMLITDKEPEVGNVDEVKTLQTKSENNPQTVLSRESFPSKPDNDLSLDVEDDYEDNEKDTDEKVSGQTKQGNNPDEVQYSLEGDQVEVWLETLFDGNADEHQVGETERGTLDPLGAQSNAEGDQIAASPPFPDPVEQSQDDTKHETDGNGTVQATDHGPHNNLEAVELESPHRQALSDSVAGKTEETEVIEIRTHVHSAKTQAVELQTDAPLDQLSSKEAGVSLQTLNHSGEDKSSLRSSGSAEHNVYEADDVLHSKIEAEANDKQPTTESQIDEEGTVVDEDNLKESAEQSKAQVETQSKEEGKESQALEEGEGTVVDVDNLQESAEQSKAQVETQRKEEGKESQEVEEGMEKVVNLHIGEDNKEEEKIDAVDEDKETPDGDPVIENHSSLIKDKESEVPARGGINLDQMTLDEPHREGGPDDSMVTVQATDAKAPGASRAKSINDISHPAPAYSRQEIPEAHVVETELKREYIEMDDHVEGKEEEKNPEHSNILREEQVREEHHDFKTSGSDESDRSYKAARISEHFTRQPQSEPGPGDIVNGFITNQTGEVKQEEEHYKKGPDGLSNNTVIPPNKIHERDNSDVDTLHENSLSNNADLIPTNTFQPDHMDQLESGVAIFPESSTNEVTQSDQQSHITDQATNVPKEGENINSENIDKSTIEQYDSMVSHNDHDDTSTTSALQNGAVFSEQVDFIESLKPTPTADNTDAVEPKRGGGAFGIFKNAFSYFTPKSEDHHLEANPDSSGTEKSSEPEGSLSSQQVTHVIEDSTPTHSVPDSPASPRTIHLDLQETALPLSSALYQSQVSSDSGAQHPIPEVPTTSATVTKRPQAPHGHFSDEETAILNELFGRHKLQWLDFMLLNPDSTGEDRDNDRSILLDMDSLLLYHVSKLAHRQENTQPTAEVTGLKKLQTLLDRVKDILDTGKSDVVDMEHEDDTGCISTPCLSREKDKQTATEGETRQTRQSSEIVSPTKSGEIRQFLYVVHYYTEAVFLHIMEVRELLKQLIVQVVLVLPDDIRPGPDLYGVPWEPVIITSLVGLVTILMFSCRFYNSVKSRINRGKERRVAKHIADLLNEKCQVLEAVCKVQTEYDELEAELRDSGVLAQMEKAEQLELNFSQLELSNQDLERDLEVLKEQLKTQKEHRVQQERKIAELEKNIKAGEKETKELQAQEEEALTTLKVYNMNSERLQRNLGSAEEENKLLQESNTQLGEQTEGWVERVSELEEEMRRCEAAHTVMQQDVDTKDHRIKYLTDRLLGMKALDSDLEQEEEGGPDPSNGDDVERHLQKVQKLIYAAKLNADLKSMDEDKDRTFAKLNDEIQAKEELQQGIQVLEVERSSLQTQAEHYTEQVQRLQQKLLIMTEMYQENELKLHRLLTVEEKERLQKEEKLNKADKNISLAMEELDNYRQQADNMEEELEKTKQSYQTQISSHEKKAHNNWLAARAAERDLADIRRENALLRQKLTDTQFKLDTIDKDPYALDSLARPLPFRGERSPYGPPPMARPGSETRPFLSPPTLMEGPSSRLSPRVPRVPLEPSAGGREMVERSGGPHSDGSNSPTWERDRRGPPPPPPPGALRHPGPLGPPGYMFQEPGPPMYRRPPPMGLPPPHPGLLGPPRGHAAAMGPHGPPMPMDMDMANQPRPADLRPEMDGRMGGNAVPPGPPFPLRGPHGPPPPDFYPPAHRMPMWRPPPPHPGSMFPPPRMLPPGGPRPLPPLHHHPSPYPPGVRPPFAAPPDAHFPPPPPHHHLPPSSSPSSADPRMSPQEQGPSGEQAPSPQHLL